MGGLFLWPTSLWGYRQRSLGSQGVAQFSTELSIMKSCCITGHRRTGLPQSRLYQVIETLTDMAKSEGADHFYMGCSWGVDLAAGEVWGLTTDWTAVKPCANHGEGVWTQATLDKRDRIISQAQEIETLQATYHPGCLNDRNEWMVDQSEIVIAIFDGRQHGGTKHCLSYARRQGKRIIWYDLRDGRFKSVN